MELKSNSPETTKEFAKKFCEELINLDGPVIVELFGELGSGKTTFMKGVGEFFQVKEEIISPTFLIQRNYKIGKECKFNTLVHIDAYRIEKKEELETIDWEKYSKNSNNLIFIEWPNQMQIKINSNFIVEMTHVSENERGIKIIKNV